MKKEYIFSVFGLIAIVLFGLFVYPTMYRYDKLNQSLPVKINRFTGKTEVLTIQGWMTLADYQPAETSPSPQPATQSPTSSDEPQKDQNGYTYDEYFEKIKENTKHPEKLDNAHEYRVWRQKVLGLREYDLVPDDNGERFTFGSTKEDVKAIMGAPDQVNKSEHLKRESWFYGSSYVTFKNEIVSEWHNLGNNLKVE